MAILSTHDHATSSLCPPLRIANMQQYGLVTPTRPNVHLVWNLPHVREWWFFSLMGKKFHGLKKVGRLDGLCGFGQLLVLKVGQILGHGRTLQLTIGKYTR